MMKKGFTLIELLVVMAITGILGMLSIASFNGYSKVQTLKSSSNDLVVMLNLAKSRAQSQIKPSACSGSLNGYKVITSNRIGYTLYASCSGGDIEITEEDKLLSSNVNFVNNQSFSFSVQTGAAQARSVVVCNSGGKAETVSVSSSGVINSQSSTCAYVPVVLPTATPVPPTATPVPPTATPVPTSPPGSQISMIAKSGLVTGSSNIYISQTSTFTCPAGNTVNIISTSIDTNGCIYTNSGSTLVLRAAVRGRTRLDADRIWSDYEERSPCVSYNGIAGYSQQCRTYLCQMQLQCSGGSGNVTNTPMGSASCTAVEVQVLGSNFDAYCDDSCKSGGWAGGKSISNSSCRAISSRQTVTCGFPGNRLICVAGSGVSHINGCFCSIPAP
jgi:prepilin-type N-terminal cleavage/methylation domain-containing protein